jgi:hypothetical protein
VSHLYWPSLNGILAERQNELYQYFLTQYRLLVDLFSNSGPTPPNIEQQARNLYRAPRQRLLHFVRIKAEELQSFVDEQHRQQNATHAHRRAMNLMPSVPERNTSTDSLADRAPCVTAFYHEFPRNVASFAEFSKWFPQNDSEYERRKTEIYEQYLALKVGLEQQFNTDSAISVGRADELLRSI